MTKSQRKNVLPNVRIEPTTVRIPGGRISDRATAPGVSIFQLGGVWFYFFWYKVLYTYKQCRSELHAAECGIWSGPCLIHFMEHQYKWVNYLLLQYSPASHMRPVTRKPVFRGVQPGNTQTILLIDQLQMLARVKILDITSMCIILHLPRKWTTKVPIRLYECAGWSVHLLFAYDIRQVFSERGSYISVTLFFTTSYKMYTPNYCHFLTKRNSWVIG